MQFNPITKDIFTDEGQFIKRLECPFKLSWEVLTPIQGTVRQKHCSQCESNVTDTDMLDDETLRLLVSQESTICLKVSLLQSNVTLTTNSNYENKK
jgi:hypothetical protein